MQFRVSGFRFSKLRVFGFKFSGLPRGLGFLGLGV